MKKFLLLLAVSCGLASSAFAQFTIVTGTVKDANGIAYAGGTISASLVVPGGCTPTLNGVSFTGSMSPIGLDSTGSFTALLADNNVVNCAGTGTTQWKFLVNTTGAPPPIGSGPQTCTATLTITGASQSLSSSFAACPNLGVGPLAGIFSGTETFTGPLSARVGQNIYAGYNFNNRIFVDGCVSTVTTPKYANTSAGINSAISAAIALGGGVVDATVCNSLATYNSEIDVGNTSSVPVLLLLPSGNSGGNPSWLATITGGTAFALKVFNNSAVISQTASGYNPFFIALASGSSVGAVCGNDTTVANAHIRMEGFMCGVYGNSPTVNQAVGLFVGMSDGAYIGHMTFEALGATGTTSKVLWVHGNCCGAAFHSIVADAYGITGITPCWFGNNALNDGNLAIGVDHIACVHPGSGAHNLTVQQWAQYTGSVFSNVYIEMATGADTTTSWVSIQPFSSPTGADTFTGITAGGDVASSTRYLFDIASGSLAIIQGAQQGGVSTNYINDHSPNGGAFTQAINSTGRPYFQLGPGAAGFFVSDTGTQTITNKTNYFGIASLAAQTATLPTANLIASAPVGEYLIQIYMPSTVTCATPGPAQVVLTLSWSDETGARTQTFTQALGTTTGLTNTQIPVWVNSVTSITYATALTACTTGAATYALRLSAAKVQ